VARIFISSTTEDLKEHREAAMAILKRLGHEPVLLENLTADPHKAPLDQSRALIDSCEAFIGILAWRYGYVTERDNPEGLSFVELEHRYAWESRKPTFIFMTQEDAPWPPNFMDSGQQAQKVNRFRTEVKDRVTVSFFSTPEDLSQKVAVALSNWKPVIPSTVDQFELAWRLVVEFKANPALLRHMGADQLKEAVDKWMRESGYADPAPSSPYELAQDQLRQKQTGLAPHPLWLAWMYATRTELEPNRAPARHG
jgi:uncharacterized protein DUF4062